MYISSGRACVQTNFKHIHKTEKAITLQHHSSRLPEQTVRQKHGRGQRPKVKGRQKKKLSLQWVNIILCGTSGKHITD